MHTLDWQMKRSRRISIPDKQEQVLLGRAIRAWQDHPEGPDAAPVLVQKRGKRALDRLVSGNLRLVGRMVSRYSKMCTPGFDEEDLMQQGCIGLWRAAMKFRPDLGYAFSTYATWWIRQELQRSKAKAQLVPLPHQANALLEKFMAISSAHPTLTLEEVAARCSTVSYQVKPERLKELTESLRVVYPVSLDKQLQSDSDGSSSSLHEFVIADSSDLLPMQVSERRELLKALRGALDGLSPNELDVVREVLIEGQTFQAIATRLGIHRDTVRKAHGRVMVKLKSSLEEAGVA